MARRFCAAGSISAILSLPFLLGSVSALAAQGPLQYSKSASILSPRASWVSSGVSSGGAPAALAGESRLLLAQGDDSLLGGSGGLLGGGGQPAQKNQKSGSKGGEKKQPASGGEGAPLGGGSLLGGGESGGQSGQGGGGLLQGGGLLEGAPATGGTVFTGKQAAEKQKKEGEQKAPEKAAAVGAQAGAEHAALFAENKYPSAAVCRTCHPRQYQQWSVSQHSYSQLSPVYMAMQRAINAMTNGSNGDFCFRCHTQVGANLKESINESNLKRHPTSREGITCIVCHRMPKAYNKVSGRFAIVQGPLTDPVYGPTGDAELKRVLSDPKYKVVTDPKTPGRHVHRDVVKFADLSSSTFCATCHDVTLFNGFRLEEAFSEYRTSPAAARGVTCQDCHMGKVQGKPSGYDYGPAAVVGGVPTKPRKLTDHTFAGPDYSVVHPGIFPHNSDAQKMATLAEWLQFDYKAGWGTDKFENNIPAGYKFPKRWQYIDDRYDARAVLDQQFKLLKHVREKRLELLRNGYHLGDIVVEKASPDGLEFKVEVKNATDGHNAPTGFTGERLVWLHVTVTDSEGAVVFRSGDRDPNGDVRDDHSAYVGAGEARLDHQLFSLQSRFLVRNLRGGERERVIPIPYSTSALPYIRPSPASTILTGKPATARSFRVGIDPLGHRWAEYHVDGDKLTGKGPYHVTVRLDTQMVPVNLIAAIQSVGFDYHMSARTVADRVVAGHEVLWKRDADIRVDEQ